MCGINGISFSDVKTIEQMNTLLSHRGPDAEQVFVDDFVSLGHTRLAILDLNIRSNQPMELDDLVIVFNGEIYNFQDVREELKSAGTKFRTKSDTEVIVKGYKLWGVSILEKLEGMFSFCIYDKKNRCLFLARDRFGIKPLYYLKRKEDFVFSSEIKPIEKFAELRVDRYNLFRALAIGHSYNETLFEGLESCPPGNFLLFDLNNKTLLVKPFFRITDSLRKADFEGGVGSSVVEQELVSAIRRQSIADVEFGVVCSGGLDSSLITAIVAKSNIEVPVFFCDVQHAGFSEDYYVRHLLDHIGVSSLIKVSLGKENFTRHLVDCVFHMEYPLAHPNSIGISLIAERAKEVGVKVLLTGEGADELFGGYIDRHRHAFLLARQISQIEKSKIFKLLLHSGLGFTIAPTFVKFLTSSSPRACDAIQIFRENDIKVNDQMVVDLFTYLEPILVRQDRMSMMYGVEARVPFLDERVVDLAGRIPLSDKINFFNSKIILRRIAKGYLPKSIITRKKMGFSIPINEWIKPKANFFSDGIIERVFRVNMKHYTKDHRLTSNLLWRLVNIEVWGRLFLEHEDPSTVKEWFLCNIN
jgi:asparagine synthase (glutamine-hydrolysing)